eukprot:TRINITY_DN33661_c1_g1_i1.p1 TRINITY_DN33661_c1_g1~~TRINITY_DN33661_c1_g1_i1.p1  ORF type:complete len:119 (-),score=7.74 TRINITY_DN33661_c1_g1_i1:164-520(-)
MKMCLFQHWQKTWRLLYCLGLHLHFGFSWLQVPLRALTKFCGIFACTINLLESMDGKKPRIFEKGSCWTSHLTKAKLFLIKWGLKEFCGVSSSELNRDWLVSIVGPRLTHFHLSNLVP